MEKDQIKRYLGLTKNDFEKKGLLVKVSDKNKISYAFIFYNKDSSIYFSLVLIELCLMFIKIFYKVIWKVIQYLKRENCKKFYLGVTKSIFSKNLITDKIRALIFLNLLLEEIKTIL